MRPTWSVSAPGIGSCVRNHKSPTSREIVLEDDAKRCKTLSLGTSDFVNSRSSVQIRVSAPLPFTSHTRCGVIASAVYRQMSPRIAR